MHSTSVIDTVGVDITMIAVSGGWWRRGFGHSEPVPPAEPVQRISFYEAEALAAWAGKRLPSEAEWERAAQGAVPAADANLLRHGRVLRRKDARFG